MKMKIFILALLILPTVFFPYPASAQCPPDCGFGETVNVSPGGPGNFADLIRVFIDIIIAAIPFVAGLALLVFVWGLVKFIYRVGGDEKAVTEGKNLMIWGVIALFVMVSIWGILRFVYSEAGFNRSFGIPTLPTGGN